jgi:prophage tail gpP-like protein
VPELSLHVGTFKISGWQSIELSRSLDDMCDSFNVSLSSPLSSAPPEVDIVEGLAVQVKYDDELMLTGYIDEVDDSSNVSSFTLRISGRSRACDIADCSAIHKGGWKSKKLDAIADSIASEFGIKVSTDLLDLPTESFRLQSGETAFDAIDRLVREHGLRVVSDPGGDLVLTRTGLERFPDVVIERGVNVVEGGVRRSQTERYSQYIFKASLAASDNSYGDTNQIKYAVTDEGVERHRPLVVKLEGAGSKNAARLKDAAEWERNTRAGKSQKLSYRVVMPGAVARSWEMPGGHGTWRPNVIVAVRDTNHNVDGQFLVTAVTLSRSSNGTETRLELTHPEAYEPKKPPKLSLIHI